MFPRESWKKRKRKNGLGNVRKFLPIRESLSYFKIFWNHIGTDIKTIGAPNEATPDISKHVISDILRQRSFIIVGTL